MADASIDILRSDALHKRIHGIPGGHRIVWSAKDAARIRDHLYAVPEKVIREAPAVARNADGVLSGSVSTRRKLAQAGISVERGMKSDDLNFLFAISSESIDLAGDAIKVAGIDCANFNKNPVVLNSHDSAELPIATSSAPSVSGSVMTAIARFPSPGVSDDSDQVAAAIRAGLARGASVGFVPVKWSFSKDPARPFGVDFQEVRLLEWSICSIPCNPTALLIGAVSGKSARSAGDTPAQDQVNWECHADMTMPVNCTDDPYDANRRESSAPC